MSVGYSMEQFAPLPPARRASARSVDRVGARPRRARPTVGGALLSAAVVALSALLVLGLARVDDERTRSADDLDLGDAGVGVVTVDERVQGPPIPPRAAGGPGATAPPAGGDRPSADANPAVPRPTTGPATPTPGPGGDGRGGGGDGGGSRSTTSGASGPTSVLPQADPIVPDVAAPSATIPVDPVPDVQADVGIDSTGIDAGVAAEQVTADVTLPVAMPVPAPS